MLVACKRIVPAPVACDGDGVLRCAGKCNVAAVAGDGNVAAGGGGVDGAIVGESAAENIEGHIVVADTLTLEPAAAPTVILPPLE